MGSSVWVVYGQKYFKICPKRYNLHFCIIFHVTVFKTNKVGLCTPRRRLYKMYDLLHQSLVGLLVCFIVCLMLIHSYSVSLFMHMLMWNLWVPPPGWPRDFWWKKGLSVRILTLPLAFTVRIPSQKIYISTICNVRMK